METLYLSMDKLRFVRRTDCQGNVFPSRCCWFFTMNFLTTLLNGTRVSLRNLSYSDLVIIILGYGENKTSVQSVFGHHSS